MYRIEKFRQTRSALFAFARGIRQEVFVTEQQVPESLEYEHDEEAWHYLLFEDDIPKATARWRETESGIKLERFAIPLKFRNKGLGSIILKRVLDDTQPLRKTIYLHAQVSAVRFYERAGFATSGGSFFEAGIEHYRMVYSGDESI
jgi:predicted GNAT family N-acyltransferase